MRTFLLLLLVLGGGCKWFDNARAEHHDDNAKEEAKKLNLGAALDEHQKANDAHKAAKKDPLP